MLTSAKSPRVTLDALRAAGYAPVLESETGTTVVERLPQRRAAAGSDDAVALARKLLGSP